VARSGAGVALHADRLCSLSLPRRLGGRGQSATDELASACYLPPSPARYTSSYTAPTTMAKAHNPADAHRKAQKKRELAKNKEDRKKARDVAVVKKDTRSECGRGSSSRGRLMVYMCSY
jgi:hypothetical protein